MTRLRYVALGDSYTIGTSVAPDDRWPERLVRRLAATAGGGGQPKLDLVANLGIDGFTSADLIRVELPQLDALAPEFASVLVGVNDAVQGVPAATYRTNLEVIFGDLLGRLGPARIVAVSTPDYTLTPAGADYGDPVTRRAAIDANNAILVDLARARGVAVVDVTAISRRASTDLSLVATDGLHPSGRQYELWVEAIAPVVEGLLGR